MPRITATVLLALAIAACGSSDDDADVTTAGAATTEPAEVAEPATTPASTAPSTTVPPTTHAPTTTQPVEPALVLVTNDDGIAAEGIDVLAAALAEVPSVEVVIVAPAANASGSGDKTTEGELIVSPATTVSGIEGYAVEGFPADSVDAALDQLGIEPDLVVSGINEGQNYGPFADVSGTVGAARTAARRGIPAIAVSSGFTQTPPLAYDSAAQYVVDHLVGSQKPDGTFDIPVGVISFNVPTCAAGTGIRGLLELPPAAALPDGYDPYAVDCASNVIDVGDDVTAFHHGFAVATDVGF